VIVVVRIYVHDLVATVKATVAADPVRAARFVALRALGQRRGSDLVLRATLGGAGV
jgi:hypothetical protein